MDHIAWANDSTPTTTYYQRFQLLPNVGPSIDCYLGNLCWAADFCDMYICKHIIFLKCVISDNLSVSVVQLVKAFASHEEGRGFESRSRQWECVVRMSRGSSEMTLKLRVTEDMAQKRIVVGHAVVVLHPLTIFHPFRNVTFADFTPFAHSFSPAVTPSITTKAYNSLDIWVFCVVIKEGQTIP